MRDKEFCDRLNSLISEAQAGGLGSRRAARHMAVILSDFILSEAGAYAPSATEEVVAILNGQLAEAMTAEWVPSWSGRR
jgi:hypothetical protein